MPDLPVYSSNQIHKTKYLIYIIIIVIINSYYFFDDLEMQTTVQSININTGIGNIHESKHGNVTLL